MHHAVGLGLLAFVIVFVFGVPAARIIIGAGLLVTVLAFAYIMFRVVAGTV